MEANNLNMPGAIISKIKTTKQFAYNKGDMTFSVDVNVDSEEQVSDMLEIMSICTTDLQQELLKMRLNETKGIKSPSDFQPVSEGEEA
jgi:hypothetical protein